MKKLLLSGAAVAAMFVIAPAIAQPAPPPPPGVAGGTAPGPQMETHIYRMPMKAETRDEAVAHAREMFGKLDANHDGFVTREEADSMHQAMAGDMHEEFAERLEGHDMPKIDRGAMFDKLDANKDGAISRQEFMAAQPQVHERRVIVMRDGDGPDGDGPAEIDGGPGEPHVKIMRMHGMGVKMHGRMFESADANHDGKVSLQEMTDAALHHFDEADANHDGTLTPDERMQMHQRMKAAHAKPA
jgi:Ca2+-binding EF-hand superfamily protein